MIASIGIRCRLAIAAFASAAIAWSSHGHAEPAAGGLAPAIERPAPAAEAPPVAEAPAVLRPPPRPAFYVRLGGALVKPVSSSRELELVGVHGAASLAVQAQMLDDSGHAADVRAFAGAGGFLLGVGAAVADGAVQNTVTANIGGTITGTAVQMRQVQLAMKYFF